MNCRGSSKRKYQYHPSITIIKNIMKSDFFFFFSFQPVSIDKVTDKIANFNTKKACLDSDMPVILMKINEDIFSRLIINISTNLLSMINFLTV